MKTEVRADQVSAPDPERGGGEGGVLTGWGRGYQQNATYSLRAAVHVLVPAPQATQSLPRSSSQLQRH